MAIAIDGPAGAGKSTIGVLLADRLGYRFFDTGVLYRAVTLAALRQGVPVTDEARLAALAAALDVVFERAAGDDGRHYTVWLDNEDVTWALRGTPVNDRVSTVSAHPRVRAALLERQRVIGRQGPIVMVGRDIGTVVLPDAEVKVYLDASAAERARRRYVEQQQRGEPGEPATVLAGVQRRDEQDRRRATSPLRPAPDALVIDTDGLGVDEVLQAILAHLDGLGRQPTPVEIAGGVEPPTVGRPPR